MEEEVEMGIRNIGRRYRTEWIISVESQKWMQVWDLGSIIKSSATHSWEGFERRQNIYTI